jgi:uncharacterized membrane protein YphA (DoxX/SURF4 family)
MTIWTLLTIFAVGGAILSALTWRIQKDRLMAFLQYFTGVWFLFSGVVKAVDPHGTALKMQDYFAEFISTFGATSFKFLVPMLKWMSENALAFSIATIVLEIAIGILLILGQKTKFTSWALLLLMVFFTALTGYTHLSGYVPDGVNFFEFGKWGNWVETNMKVTDCGCFGDFLKLKPTTSFYKDLALMPVCLFFVFRRSRMTALFTEGKRRIIGWATVAFASIFCLWNSFMDEPIADFRPFKNGVNIREQKKAEEKASADVKILTWKLKNIQTGEKADLPNETYMANYQTQYAKEKGWEIEEQVKSEMAIPRTKISDFLIESPQGEDMTDSLLLETGYTFLVVSGKVKSTESKTTIQVPDSLFIVDSVKGTKTFDRVQMREEVIKAYSFDAHYREAFAKTMNPILEAAEKAGHKIAAVVPYSDPKKIEDFRHAAQTAYPFYRADEKLIKTMMRSNPGLILLKDGAIVHKWHLKKVPNFDEIKAAFIK